MKKEVKAASTLHLKILKNLTTHLLLILQMVG